MERRVAQARRSSGPKERRGSHVSQNNGKTRDRFAGAESSLLDGGESDGGSLSVCEPSGGGRGGGFSQDGRGEHPTRKDRDYLGESEKGTGRKRSRKEASSPGRRSPGTAGSRSWTGEEAARKRKEWDEPDLLLRATRGAYMPASKLRRMQEEIPDANSLAYQRLSWEALKKSIQGLLNRVTVSNIRIIIQELLQENLVRGRGLLSRSVLRAQRASPNFTPLYAALVAIINSKFPHIGELVLKRLILNFRKGYRRDEKGLCLASASFLAHLVNQNVAHEVLLLEMLTLLLERATDDSVEVAVALLRECGLKLSQVTPRGMRAVFERLRAILQESGLHQRVQYQVEVMFALRKGGFQDHPVLPDGLDLVEEGDQFTHLLPLGDDYDPEDVLDVFRVDPTFLEKEEKYRALQKEILDQGDSEDDSITDLQEAGSSEGEEEDEEEEEEEGDQEEEGGEVPVQDHTEASRVSFRRKVYLAIQSSLDVEECAHKLLKMDCARSQSQELCTMILDCCARQRTYDKFFGLLAGRFCRLTKDCQESFEGLFREQYATIHRLETNPLRNVAKMFAHLVYTDSLPWSVLECIKLGEAITTASSRIWVKIFLQELCGHMGLGKLNARFKEASLQPFLEGLFPRDSPGNTRFAINFFTSIGLGGLTEELRQHLKTMPKVAVP